MKSAHLSGFTFWILLSSLLVLMLSACASIESGRNVVPVKLQITDNLQLPFKIEKCLLDQRTGTYYLREQNRPNIYFYRNRKQINLLGGFGTEKTNFQKLSDIALDADGNLLALDSFAKIIRKFSPDGKWIADIDVSRFNQPSNICSIADTDLIIYDAASKELSRLSTFDGKVMFTFGKFQVESVSHINSAGDFIVVVSEDRQKTVLFTAMGQYLKEIPSQMVLDRFQNQYVLQDGALRYIKGDLAVPMDPQNIELKLFSSYTAILLVSNDAVTTITPIYQGNE